MDDKLNRHSNYVGRLQEDTQRVVRELIAENEKLREELRKLTFELERSSSRYSEEFAQIEKRSADLANLYVSSYQLHGTLDREAVLTAIKEIVINLIGCEELGIFEMQEGGRELDLIASFGVDEARYARLAVAADPLGRLVATGEMYIAGTTAAPAGAPPFVACIPLKLDGRVTGAVVLFSLLPHKPALQEIDYELFDLLATHAATALYCTALYARTAGAAV